MRLLQRHQSAARIQRASHRWHQSWTSQRSEPGDPALCSHSSAEEEALLPHTARHTGSGGRLQHHLSLPVRPPPGLALPTSFLVDQDGMIVKVYQGPVNPERLCGRCKSVPSTRGRSSRKAFHSPERSTRRRSSATTLPMAWPFPARLSRAGRGIIQAGHRDQARRSRGLLQPGNTLPAKKCSRTTRAQYLEQTVKLRPDYPEAWNNLGMLAAQQGNATKRSQLPAIVATAARLCHRTANLGNLYRRQGNLAEAEKLLNRALELQPDNPEVNYNLGMLYARAGATRPRLPISGNGRKVAPRLSRCAQQSGRHICSRKELSRSAREFKTCIRVAPNFDQAYLNLARLYVDSERERKSQRSFARIASPAAPAQGGPADAGNAKLTFGGL